MSAGVQRQYTGTAGRVENCQVGVFLAYEASDGSRALIDRELYLPQKWCEDKDRCAQAGIPEGAGFATKPALAREMIERAVAAAVPFGWLAADEVYGQNRGLRDWLEEQHIRYVMAVPCNEQVTTAAGKLRVDELAAKVRSAAWQVLSCGEGSKGPRLYEWALIGTARSGRHLLVRRSLARRERPAGTGVLPGPRPGRHDPGRARGRRRGPLGGRGLLRRGQERDRPRSLPGAQMGCLVPARHAGNACPRVPGRARPRQPGRVPGGTCPARRRRVREKGDPPPVDNDSRRRERTTRRCSYWMKTATS
jgi:hypothetical protein